MESKKRALLVLFLFVCTSVVVFLLERKLLLAKKRQVSMQLYSSVEGYSKLKGLIEDFEGLEVEEFDPTAGSFFNFGSVKLKIDTSLTVGSGYLGHSVMCAEWAGEEGFGGWGKGVMQPLDLNTDEDFLNIYVFIDPANPVNDSLKIILEDDDTGNGVLEKDKDDSWSQSFIVKEKNSWKLVSLPLRLFKDTNPTVGDGVLNIGDKGGKLLTFIVALKDGVPYKQGQKWYFDFVSFSKGPLSGE